MTDPKDAVIADLVKALKPFAAMCHVLDCRDMHEKNETNVYIGVPFDMERSEDIVLSGDVLDNQVILNASASAYGTPASFIWNLHMGNFRAADAALATASKLKEGK